MADSEDRPTTEQHTQLAGSSEEPRLPEWQQAPLRPRLSARQKQKEAEQLATWSATWHDHLERTFAQAEQDLLQMSGLEGDPMSSRASTQEEAEE